VPEKIAEKVTEKYWSRQPSKGICFTLLSVPLTVVIWYLLTGLFGLGYGPATTVITVCFAFFWQVGWSFGGWPASRWTSNRWLRGTCNWVLLMLLVWLTAEIWHLLYHAPFASTQIGLWGQTAIIAGVASLFFFGNTLLVPAELADKQPMSGIANLIWGVLFVPAALLLLPKLAGGGGWYIPWVWFPIAVVVMSYFGGWPFDRLGQPRAGIAYLGTVFFLTVVFLDVLRLAGINFFGAGDAGVKAAIFAATWTNVGLVSAWLFNNWPAGRLPQPAKGLALTAGSLVLSVAAYAVLIAAVGNLPALLFGEFAFMWAHVSLAGVGLVDGFSWGYEEDPGGAGLGRRATAAEPAAQDSQPAAQDGAQDAAQDGQPQIPAGSRR
jgi:hypothetical protein